jgi:hypothetical protein
MEPLNLIPPNLGCESAALGIARWREAVDLSDQFLLAGLRREIGPEGDIDAAYRRWYEEYRREHDRALIHLAEEFNRRGGTDGG